MATRDLLHFLLFLLLTLLAEVLGTIGGFGSSVYFVPLFQWLFDFQTVLALTGLLHVFSNTAKLYLFWKTINWQLVLTMGVSSLLLAVTGAYLTTFVNVSILKLTLGTLLIA
ncbi:MAG: sulfite exporter TauE/SafE family protein, partial [Cyclobacteriaceae bacterium]|nr:sulfite exporter TauE/SafE family protein [Cyclobacteriaceae bacterium]